MNEPTEQTEPTEPEVQRSPHHALDLVDFPSGTVYVHYDGKGDEHVHSVSDGGHNMFTHTHEGGSTTHEHFIGPEPV